MTAIPARTWARTLDKGVLPSGIKAGSLAFAVHPGGLWASIAVAWHLEDQPADLAAEAWALDAMEEAEERVPLVGFKILHHQAGNDRLAQELFRIVKQTGLIINHGAYAQEKAVVQELMDRARPRPKAYSAQFAEVAVAHTRLLNGLKHNQLVHWQQEPLDASARIAALRMVGKSRVLSMPDNDPHADITPLEAVAIAVQRLPAPRQRIAAIVVD